MKRKSNDVRMKRKWAEKKRDEENGKGILIMEGRKGKEVNESETDE